MRYSLKLPSSNVVLKMQTNLTKKKKKMIMIKVTNMFRIACGIAKNSN